MAHALSIVESQEVAKLIDKLCHDFQRFGDAWEGWKWRLARSPTTDASPFPGAGGSEVYMIKTSSSWAVYGLPIILTIAYTVSDTEVTVLSIRVTDLQQ